MIFLYGEPSFFDATANIIYFVISLTIIICFFVLCNRVGKLVKLLKSKDSDYDSILKEAAIAEFSNNTKQALYLYSRALYIGYHDGSVKIVANQKTAHYYNQTCIKKAKFLKEKIESLGGKWPLGEIEEK